MRTIISLIIFFSINAEAKILYFKSPGNYLVLGKVEIADEKTKLILLEDSMAEIDVMVKDSASANKLKEFKNRRVLACVKIKAACGPICDAEKVDVKKTVLPWDSQVIPEGHFKPADPKVCP